MTQFIQGTFTLEADDGTVVSKLLIADSRGSGLRQFFRRRGGEPGDYLALAFDLASKRTVGYMGDGNLFHDLKLVE